MSRETPGGKPRILVILCGEVLFGQERGNIEAIAALRELGAEALFILRADAWCVSIAPALDAQGFAWEKIDVITIPRKGVILRAIWRNLPVFVRSNWRFLRIVAQFKPTHIHACNQLHVLYFLAALLLSRKPLIFRAGDEPTAHNPAWNASWKFIVKRATRFVANSRYVANSLVRGGVPPDRVTLIYNAPPSRPSVEPFALEPELPAGARVFGYVGQIAEHKGVHLLVEAFAEIARDFPDAHLLIAGRISDWVGDAWGRALRDRALGDPSIRDRIRFLGEISDVAGMLARCEALIVPSLFEDPSPNVVTEAKLAGRAAIVFPRGGLPELVENGVDGVVCAEPSAGSLAAAWRIYLRDPKLASAHGTAALASLTRLGVYEFGRKWGEVYGLADGPAAV